MLATPAPEVSVVAAPSALQRLKWRRQRLRLNLPAAAQTATPAEITASSATPATALAPEKVAQFTPSPSFGERISSFTGQRPLVFWLFILGAIVSAGAWLVMEARRLISRTTIGHRPATVTGPSLHDDHAAEEETPQLQTQNRFVGGPRQISVELKASEPALGRAVILVAKRVVEPVAAPPVEPETAAAGGRTVEPAYVDFEESSVRTGNRAGASKRRDRDCARAASISFANVYRANVCAEPIESVIEPSIEPAIEQAEPEPVAAAAENSAPSEPVRECDMSEPVEAQASVLETEVCEPPVAEAVSLSEIEEQISTRESSPQPEPIEQGQPVPYQIVVTAEQPAEIAASEKPEIAAVAEIAGVGRAIAGLGALPDGTEIPTTSDEEHLASQPTTIETMPETLQTPTAPVIQLVACTRLFKSPSLAKSLRCS